MGKKLLMFLACLFTATSMAFAQFEQVAGTVIDSDTGEPLAGASVKVIGTTMGTLTDINGKFTLKNLPKSAEHIEVSFMGMNTVRTIIKRNMAITLTANASDMDEVMVVAYGNAKRSTFAGSAGELKSEMIANHVTSNAMNALSGTVAGVNVTGQSSEPGSSPVIRIRGIGSINASSSPLYIVDGAPTEAGIANINPNDIESMTVLKDASASAIYGARGANGVILITTKKGKAGKDADIKFEAKWGSNSRLVPNYDIIDNPAQYYEAHYTALYNSQYTHGASSEAAHAYANKNLFDDLNGGLGYKVFTVPEGQNLIGTNFKLNPNATLGYTDGQYTYIPDDWYNEAFHSSFRQEYNLSASGSSGKFNYYAGIGYLDDGGFVSNSGFQRYSGRLNVDFQAKKWLKLYTNMGFTHTDSQKAYTTDQYGSSGSLFYIANSMGPIYPLYVRDANGNIMKNDMGGNVYDANQTNFHRPGVVGNAIRDNEYDRRQYYRDLFQGRWGLDITPVDGLKLSAVLAAEVNNARNNTLQSQFGGGISVDGAVDVSHTRYFNVNQQYLANYNKTFAEVHNLDILVGFEHYTKKYQSLSASNFVLFDPYVGELDNTGSIKNRSLGSHTRNYTTQGAFSRVSYDYDGKYFVSGSFRYDMSSIFAPGHRWGKFGSVAAGWDIAKEKFMSNVKWVNQLKPKVSWGSQGNDALGGTWQNYADLYSAAYNEETKTWATKLEQKGNDELTWETNQELNVGLDFALFKNRLTGSIDYFHRKTTDMLWPRTVSLSSGLPVQSYDVNVGDMVNQGVEITLNGTAIKTKNFEWNLTLNMTHVKNEITYLDPSLGPDGLVASSYLLREGYSRYTGYMLKYAGVDKNGKALYFKDAKDKNGNVTGLTTTTNYDEADKYIIGDYMPKLYGGFGTSLTYKGFDLSLTFSYQLGGKTYDGGYQQTMHNGLSAGQAMHKDLLNAWSPTNTSSNIPVLSAAKTDDGFLTSSQTALDYFVTSSNYLSLNTVNFGYTIPKEITRKIAMENLRIYFTGENLFLLTARQGLDPRFSIGTGSMTSGSGLANQNYGAARSIVGGIQITF